MTLTTRPCPWGCGTPLTFLPEPYGLDGRCPGCGHSVSVQGDQLARVQITRLERSVLGMIDVLRNAADLLASLVHTPPDPVRPRTVPTRPAGHATPAPVHPRDRRPERSPATRRY